MLKDKSWQCNYWKDSIKMIIPSIKLSSGIKYAKSHKIHNIEVKDNKYTSQVVEDEDKTYDVTIKFRQFTKKQKRYIHDLKYDARYIDYIDENIFPESLHNQLYRKGIDVFPSSIINIDVDCNCTDKKIICNHVITALYEFSDILEENPLILFQLKGSNITNLPYRTKKRKNNSKKKQSAIKNINDLINTNTITGFDDQEKPQLNSIPDLLDLNMTLLKNNPQLNNTNFQTLLNEIYTSTSDYLEQIEEHDLYNNRGYNDFLQLPTLDNTPRSKAKKHTQNYYFHKKWGDLFSWKYLHININGNYSLTGIDVGCNSPIRKYKGEKYLFAFLTELSKIDICTMNRDLTFFMKLYELTLELVRKHALTPEIFRSNDRYKLRWIPSYTNRIVSQIINQLSLSCPEYLITFNRNRLTPKNQIITAVSIIFKGLLDNYLAEHELKYEVTDKTKNIYELLTTNTVKMTELKENDAEDINNWIKPMTTKKSTYNIYFEVEEIKNYFKINVKVKVDDNQITDIRKVIKTTKDKKLEQQLQQDIKTIKEVFPEIDTIIEDNGDVELTLREFSNFFNKTMLLLETMGVKIILPKSLEKRFHPKLVLNMKRSPNAKSYISLDNLIDFDWKVAIGDNYCSISEFEKISCNTRNLVRIADKYVILDDADIQELLEKIHKLPERIDSYDLMKGIITGQVYDSKVNVEDSLRNQLTHTQKNTVKLPENLEDVLRGYQKTGYTWLLQNIQTGFGSILADDMGLGKTVQVLTLIQQLKYENMLDDAKVLVVAPTSLLYNWQREVSKFTPDLKTFIYHGTDRSIATDNYDVFITSYGIVRQDINVLKDINWLLVVVDEAQNIKNPQTKQTRAVKNLNARYKIALTGTPIENRLSEYWSIFDFVNHGYLGAFKDFKDNFIKPVENYDDKTALDNLKKLTQPFLLRRLKSDKNIIRDLPDKFTNEIYANLTTQQAALYQETLNYFMDRIELEDGIKRKGLVLELITALKQICNHPAQYTKTDKISIDDSGKTQLLVDTLENILENDEKVIIFTQYVQMGDILVKLLEERFDEEVLFLHGSLSRRQRDVQITKFQEDSACRIFILSLKAGGTGLNLTAASNVIHYDLWWNPAVENQATDRAYRIGQDKNVMVYRFITTATFEERINDMIEDKRQLADDILSAGGTFITEMDDDKLKQLLSLRQF